MTPNLIFYNDYTIMIGLVVCCVIILATVMIPKAMRHRKQVRKNENEQPVPDKEQELGMTVVPSPETISEKSVTVYERRFLVKADIPTRSGKLVGIRKKYHDRISKIVRVTAENEVTIFSYVDNVLKHHFETFQDEISELYKQRFDDDYLIPKK